MDILNTLRSFIKVDDSAAQAAQEAAQKDVKDYLDILMRLGEIKAEYLKLKIVEALRSPATSENEAVPIESILETSSNIYATTKIEIDAVKNAITPLISEISPGLEGDRKKSMDSLIENLISGFLGGPKSPKDTKEHFFVYAEGLSLIRLDVYLWEQKFNFSALGQNSLGSVLVMTYCKSAINAEKINLNTFITLYQYQFARTESAMDANELNRIKQIFYFLRTGKSGMIPN